MCLKGETGLLEASRSWFLAEDDDTRRGLLLLQLGWMREEIPQWPLVGIAQEAAGMPCHVLDMKGVHWSCFLHYLNHFIAMT